MDFLEPQLRNLRLVSKKAIQVQSEIKELRLKAAWFRSGKLERFLEISAETSKNFEQALNDVNEFIAEVNDELDERDINKRF